MSGVPLPLSHEESRFVEMLALDYLRSGFGDGPQDQRIDFCLRQAAEDFLAARALRPDGKYPVGTGPSSVAVQIHGWLPRKR
jgi:hypothetical protein